MSFHCSIAMDNTSTTSAPLPDLHTLWDYSKPAETEVKFRAIIPAAEASGNRSYHMQLLTQIARCNSLQRKFEEAHAILDDVEKMMDGERGIARVRYLLERGRAVNSSGDKAGSKPFFLEALELGKELGEDNHAIDAAHMLGIVDEPEEGLRWNDVAIAMTEASADPVARRWMGPLYNNTGWTYHDKGDFARALDLFTKNVAWHTEQKTTRGLFIAKWCVGRTLRSLGRLDEALAIQRALDDEMTAAGAPDGYVCEELGECLLAEGKPDEARPHFAMAYELLSKDIWLAANEVARLNRLKELGGVALFTPSGQ
jgi:tetratricopeptide (TPR) repeat protein